MSRIAILIGVAFLGTCLTPLGANAQAVNNAQIHGVVRDKTGAFVPGAQIKATHVDTGQTATAVSGSDGAYLLPDLPVGSYTLEVTSSDFSKFIQSGIVLQVGQNVQVNVTLSVGSVTQEVHVTGDAALIETQQTSISEVIDQKRIIDLPLNGRQATDLIQLSGGAASPPNAASRDVTSHDYVNSLAISVSGGQINGNNYLLDGADNNDSHSNINMPFPFPDALQEFSVQTSGVASRFGLHPGSVVNVVTKSGTNNFHGNLFEFLRNGDLNARNYFATTQDNLRRNQYGGTLGGPIRKNKLFAFGGYQETRIRTAPPNSIAFVATPAALNGDYSALESSSCQSSKKQKQLYNPFTGQPFPNNFVSPSLFTAPSLALLKLIPISSDPCGRLTYGIPNPSNEYQYVSRVDWVQTPKHTLFARYFILDYSNPAIYTNNLADYLLGRPISLLDSGIVEIGLREKYAGIYFQDDYQATKNLNVHAGIRWEPSLPEYDVAGRGNHFSLPAFTSGTKTNVYTNAPPGLLFREDPGIPKAYAYGSYLGFAPRVGLAWDPSGAGKESVRASYGIFFDQPESYTDRDFALAAPWGNQITLTAPSGGFVNPFNGYPGGNPFPFPYPPSKSSAFPIGGSYINLPLDLHHPYMQQWGLSLQRQFGSNWVVTTDYIGNKATHFRAGTEVTCPRKTQPDKAGVLS